MEGKPNKPNSASNTKLCHTKEIMLYNWKMEC